MTTDHSTKIVKVRVKPLWCLPHVETWKSNTKQTAMKKEHTNVEPCYSFSDNMCMWLRKRCYDDMQP